MTHKRNKSGKKLIAAVVFLAAMTLPCGRLLAQQPRGFLQTVHKHVTCTSTIAENGDTNPYAIVVAPVSAGRIHSGEPPGADLRVGKADESGARKIDGQESARGASIGDGAQIEVLRPVGLWQYGRLVPEVDGAVEKEERRFPRRVVDEAVGYIGERCPHLEGRIHPEGIVLVIGEQRRRRSGMDQQRGKLLSVKRARMAIADQALVGIKERSWRIGLVAHHSSSSELMRKYGIVDVAAWRQ